jgi:hypothetical protein
MDTSNANLQAPRRATFTPCDSYFVETDEMDFAEQQRERLRAHNKRMQRQIAGELSQVTACEYFEDVLDHMERMESVTLPDVNSIDIQHEIQWYMRPYLVDFLVESHQVFGLLPETLYLTVNILDRYCSRRVVYKKHYQLVACASLLLAAKYGDKKDRVPTFRELKSICCGLYDEEMFAQMEWHVLQTLDWTLGAPTIDGFLNMALSNVPNTDTVERDLTWYLCEMSLYHRDFVAVRPSIMARSALALARAILQRPNLPAQQWHGCFDEMVIYKLLECLNTPSQILARKFSSSKLSSVTQIVEQFLHTQQQEASAVTIDAGHDSTYGSPTTPNKASYSAPLMQNGCLTPPITPDQDGSSQRFCYPPPQTFPTTPSPVPYSDIDMDMVTTDCYI